MNVRTIAPIRPPSRTPHGSILDIATITDAFPAADAEGLIESYNCIGVDVDAIDCAAFTGMTKRFDPPGFSDGSMFSVQSGVTCKPFGFNPDDPALKAAAAVLEGEGVSIGLYETILVNGTDLTPTAGAVDPQTALGLLEGAGYASYAGQPVIHVGPMLASLWSQNGAVDVAGSYLKTRLGTPVAVSAGNESKTGGKLDADQWAFVTGAVVLARSDTVNQWQLDRTTNDMTVLFERLYVVAVDCLVAKVKVNIL
jgi:hypothetical protein